MANTVLTSPFFKPDWVKRMSRLAAPKQPRGIDINDPMQAARAMNNMGMVVGPEGSIMPTQDWGGISAKASQQMNSLSRGAKPGQGSGLGMPANTMNERNPRFFNRGDVESFGQMLASRGQAAQPQMTREDRIAKAKQDGTFMSIREAFNQKAKSFGQMMDEAGNITTAAPYRPGLTTPTEQSKVSNLGSLQEAVSAKKLLAEAEGAPKVTVPTITTSAGQVPQIGAKNIAGKYGTGFATAAGEKSEGMVNGRPFSEVMQGLANKPGIARPGDKFQPQKWDDVKKRTQR